MRSFLLGWLMRFRHAANARKISGVGVGTVLSCRIDRRKAGATIRVGDGCSISGVLTTEQAHSQICIGSNVFIGGHTIIDCIESIKIEDDALISYSCLITDSDNHSIHYRIRKNDLRDWRQNGGHDWSTTVSRPVHIGKGAWIGARVIILKGVTIGDYAVVGAGSVVTRDVPANCIAAGNPARVVKELAADDR